MEEIKTLLEEKRPHQWNDIPDIDLYMDQVLNYMQRQHVGLELNETLTAAMVNNYIKKELLPRAKGKKYSREHIAYLTAICLLKQVISVNDTGELLNIQLSDRNAKDFYSEYIQIMDDEFSKISSLLDGDQDKKARSELALRLAVSSYAQKLACEAIIQSIDQK